MDEYSWPEQGLSPFGDRSAPDWEHNAWLPDVPDWLHYVAAYRRAVDVLVEHVVTQDRDQDLLIFPILFMHRHHVELALKHVISMSAQLLDETITIPAHHDLQRLWEQAVALSLRIDPPPSDEDLDAVTEAIGHLSALDRGSFTFRYPLEKDQTTVAWRLRDGPLERLINVRELGEWMERTTHFFEGTTEMLYHLREMDGYLREEYGP